ncbi:hypothetical protein K2Z84_28500 [Candidatus Binatia bacterium]|nr:hypothetical protein [Candidatus Binatia bacterium]
MSDTPTGTGDDRALAARLAACRSIADFLALWFELPLLPAEQQRVFDAHYADNRRHLPPRMRALYARQTDELIALARAQPGCRVLEIGSGSGSESLWLAMLGAHVLGVDLRAGRVAVARARQDVVERALPVPSTADSRSARCST